jgi:acetyl esterase/lipase
VILWGNWEKYKLKDGVWGRSDSQLRNPSVMAFAATLLLGLSQLQAVTAVSSLNIDTTSGPVQGFTDDITPNVAQYLGIPFAEQPVGARRWLPPAPKSKENATIKATDLGHACPQFEGNAPNVWLTDAPEFIIQPRDYQGEDCLNLHVWAPLDQCEEPLPVVVWIHGGGWAHGTIPESCPMGREVRGSHRCRNQVSLTQ